MSVETDTLIIGASLSGLAAGASLQQRNMRYHIIEKQNRAGAPWHQHYERLHLHTSKRFSNLPYKKFGKDIPTYPSRQQVIEYVNDYQKTFDIRPTFHTEALSVKREGETWVTQTNNGEFRSRFIIMATGPYGKARPVHFEGMETFPGPVLHSYQYHSGKDFAGKKVLVVGFGNSACEIAVDLFEQGALPFMSVRSAVNVIPRDILGIPVLELSLLLGRLSPRVADKLSAPLANLLIGNLSSLGLKRKPYGPMEQVQKEGMAPVLDIGTIAHIRKGHIKVLSDIKFIEGKTIHFKENDPQEFDAIVAGIGYYRDYAEFVEVDKSRFEDLRVPVGKQQYFGKDGLYFCGYWVSPFGQIREIALDAQKIAKDIQKKKESPVEEPGKSA